MNWLDVLIAIPIVWLIYKGWKRGWVREIATLVGLLAGIWAATHLIPLIVEVLHLEGEGAVLIAFFICFVGALVLAYLLGKCVEGLMKVTHLSMLNRIGGAVLGGTIAVCIVAVLLNYIVMIDKHEKVLTFDTKEKSALYRPVFITGNAFTGTLKAYVLEHKDEWLDNDKEKETTEE